MTHAIVTMESVVGVTKRRTNERRSPVRLNRALNARSGLGPPHGRRALTGDGMVLMRGKKNG
jgi:hypothetical protein